MKHGSAEHLESLGESKTKYPTSPEEAKLERIPFESEGLHSVTLFCPEYTCNCPKTGQPDFGTIYIQYIPNKWLVESKALKLYLFSFRNHGHFHEVGVEQIANDIFKLTEPHYLRVIGDFNKRGGIAIVPRTELGDLSHREMCPEPVIKYGA